MCAHNIPTASVSMTDGPSIQYVQVQPTPQAWSLFNIHSFILGMKTIRFTMIAIIAVHSITTELKYINKDRKTEHLRFED